MRNCKDAHEYNWDLGMVRRHVHAAAQEHKNLMHPVLRGEKTCPYIVCIRK